MPPDLLHGAETRVYGDSAYRGQKEVIIEAAPNAKDFTHERVQRNAPLSDVQKAKSRSKSAVRAHVEHPFFAHQATVGLRQDPLPGIDQER